MTITKFKERSFLLEPLLILLLQYSSVVGTWKTLYIIVTVMLINILLSLLFLFFPFSYHTRWYLFIQSLFLLLRCCFYIIGVVLVMSWVFGAPAISKHLSSFLILEKKDMVLVSLATSSSVLVWNISASNTLKTRLPYNR